MTADDRKQKIAIAVLAAGGTVTDAAKTSETEPATIQSWLSDPAFAVELDAARDRAFTDSMARMKCGTGRAVARLLAMINEKSAGDARRACETIITLALRVRDADEIEKRLEHIENRLAGKRLTKKSTIGGELNVTTTEKTETG